MKIAFGLTVLTSWNYPNRMFAYIPTTAERAPHFVWAKRAGFEGVEVADSWMDWYSMSTGQLEDMRAQLDAIGLPCVALNPYRCIVVGHPDAARNEEKLYRTLEVGQTWGATYLNLAISAPFPAVMSDAERAERQTRLMRGEHFTDAQFDECAAKVRQLADAAQAKGIALSIELHDDGITDRSDHVMRLHRMINRSNVGVNPDLQNGFRVPYKTEDWRTVIQNMAAATNLWHVKSNTRRYIPETGAFQSGRATLRDGDIDYRWAMTKMVEAGFDGWLTLETGGGDAHHRAEGDLRYLRNLIDEWIPLVRHARAGGV